MVSGGDGIGALETFEGGPMMLGVCLEDWRSGRCETVVWFRGLDSGVRGRQCPKRDSGRYQGGGKGLADTNIVLVEQ